MCLRCSYVRACILNVREHILKTACGNFTKFTISVHSGININ